MTDDVARQAAAAREAAILQGLYVATGRVLGILSAVVTFVGAWAYCTLTGGFLLGFGLGWLPALILAAIVGLLVWALWVIPALILFIGGVVWFILTIGHIGLRHA